MLKKYNVLIAEVSSLEQHLKIVNEEILIAENDFKWRVSELYKCVDQKDEQKFVELTGMNSYLPETNVSEGNIEVKSSKDNESSLKPIELNTQPKKIPEDKKWAKNLYRKAVKRCHPDRISNNDKDYKDTLIKLYQNLTESYEKHDYALLMVNSAQVFVLPDEINSDQISILVSRKDNNLQKLQQLKNNNAYIWSKMTASEKENFLYNYMVMQGIKFTDKNKIKNVVRKKPVGRKIGERPNNLRKSRVK